MTIDIHKLECAAAALQRGELVAFPTETVYGLGGNALSDAAVAAIYAAKGRPQFNPLIVHVASIAQAQRYVEWNAQAQALAEAFWPGPLTLVLPRKKECPLSLLVSAGLDCVAVRMPAHPVALALLEKSGLPLAAPSANRSGRISPTLAVHVAEELGERVHMVLDGGACNVGIESTIVDVSGEKPTLLRHGKITADALGEYISLSSSGLTRGSIIKKILNWMDPRGKPEDDTIIKAPGMLASHYAPNAAVRLNATELLPGEVLLAFGKPLVTNARVENLSHAGNLEEAAANLFRMLRALDAEKARTIAVMPIPMEGLGIAINDRLQRAAAPRG